MLYALQGRTERLDFHATSSPFKEVVGGGTVAVAVAPESM